jgi:HK97 family phage major capsid protein
MNASLAINTRWLEREQWSDPRGEQLNKAAWCVADITPPTGGGLLTADQAREFIRVAVLEAVILPEANVFTSNAPKFQVPRIAFTSRILHTRAGLADCARNSPQAKPTTDQVELSTVGFSGEVAVCDDLFEDNIEGQGIGDTLAALIAQAVGRDIEEIMIKGDTARTGAEDQDLRALDGLIKQMQTNLPTAQKINASAHTRPSTTMSAMLAALPANYRNNMAGLRFYVPSIMRDSYQAELALRPTALGDTSYLASRNADLAYAGIPVREVPLLSGTSTIATGAVDYTKFAFLTNPKNIYVGFHRRVRIEKFRDPREMCTVFVPSVRFDVKFGDPAFAVLAYNVPVYTLA